MKNIRNKHILKEVANTKFNDEITVKYFSKVIDDLDVDHKYFYGLCDKFRSVHLCKKINNQWKLRHNVNQTGVDD